MAWARGPLARATRHHTTKRMDHLTEEKYLARTRSEIPDRTTRFRTRLDLDDLSKHTRFRLFYDDSTEQERIERKMKETPGLGSVRMLTREEWDAIQEMRPRTPFESKIARPNAKIRTGEPLHRLPYQYILSSDGGH
ncbi:deoxyguanosinetriphosphate triphosphohydrolase [Striga asiatica]|uniref:Deoxyguanosinetriphosphate triphosphohydrolase n=1 Tax=Striga asiatica TaxID=4170 RepID=A0A5A7Q9V1_STRAF|nr:deoxyguanosinetriphosphate triphosphohydrolase [Striga asiatica]